MSDPDLLPLVVLDIPTPFERNEEIVFVRVLKLLLNQVRLQPFAFVLGSQVGLILLKLIAQPFQKQHPKDEFLVLRGIHVAPQNVARLEQLGLQPSQRELRCLLLDDRTGRSR